MKDINNIQRIRKMAFSEIEYVKYWVRYLNKNFINRHRQFYFRLVEIRNHTDDLDKYMHDTINRQNKRREYVDIFLGPESSDSIQGIIGINRFLNVSVFSYGATASMFDVTAKNASLVRFLPSDAYRTAMLIKLVNYFNWRFLSVLCSEGVNQNEARKFITKIGKQGKSVQVQSTYVISPIFSICEMVTNLNNKRPNRILVFFTSSSDTRRVLQCMKEQNLYNRFTLVFFYANNNDPDVWEGNEKILDGAIGLEQAPFEISANFEKHFESLNPMTSPNNTLLKSYWEQAFNCDVHHLNGENPNNHHGNCSFDQSLTRNRDLYLSASSSHIRRVFRVLSDLIQSSLDKYCPDYSINNVCDAEVDDVDFRFNTEIDFRTRTRFPADNVDVRSSPPVISYSLVKSVWNESTGNLMQRKAGSWSITLENNFTALPEDLLRSGNDSLVIDSIWWGKVSPAKDLLSTKQYYKPMIKILWVILGVSGSFTFFVCFVVVRNRNLGLFRGSGYELWLFILLGVFFQQLGSVTFSMPVSLSVCHLQLYIPSIGLTLCHVALCAKAFCLRDTFMAKRFSLIRRSLGQHAYVLMVIIAATVQVIIVISIAAKIGIRIEARYSGSMEREYISTHCSTSMHPLLFLLSGIAVVISLHQAYTIIHCPTNRNEGRDIVITVVLSFMLFCVTIPVYIVYREKPYNNEILLCWFFALDGVILLFGLFSQKIFHLIQVWTGRAVDQEMKLSRRLLRFSETFVSASNSSIKSIDKDMCELESRLPTNETVPYKLHGDTDEV